MAKEFSTTDIMLRTFDEKVACVYGSSEVQTIVLDASSVPDGYMYVHFQGEKSGSISANADASVVATVLNDMDSISGVSVTKHYLGDNDNNQTWIVPVPKSYGDVEPFVVDDQHVTGVDMYVGVYSMMNISMVAAKDDITVTSELLLVTRAQFLWLGMCLMLPSSMHCTSSLTSAR